MGTSGNEIDRAEKFKGSFHALCQVERRNSTLEEITILFSSHVYNDIWPASHVLIKPRFMHLPDQDPAKQVTV